jgi:hypothetical protein
VIIYLINQSINQSINNLKERIFICSYHIINKIQLSINIKIFGGSVGWLAGYSTGVSY